MQSPNKSSPNYKYIKNKSCTNIFSKMDAPKRFNRKNQRSIDSLSLNRNEKTQRKLVPQKPLMSTNPQNKQEKKVSHQSSEIIDLVKSSGYIKANNKIDQSIIKPVNNKLRIKSKTDKFFPKSLCQIKQDIPQRQQQCKKGSVKLDTNSLNNKISEEGEVCNSSFQGLQKKASFGPQINYELQYEIKVTELEEAEKQLKVLKQSDNSNKARIELQQNQLQELKKEKKLVQCKFSQLIESINEIYKNYGIQERLSVSLQTKNLCQLLGRNIEKCVDLQCTIKIEKYEEIIRNFREKITKEILLKNHYEIKAGFIDRFKVENQQLKEAQKKLKEQINKMKKRNEALAEEASSFRATNSKIRKSLTDTKKQAVAKDLTIKAMQKQLRQLKELNEKIQKNESQFLQINQKNQKKEKIKTQASVGNEQINHDPVTEAENENNLSLNISDASTQQIMDIQDIRI